MSYNAAWSRSGSRRWSCCGTRRPFPWCSSNITISNIPIANIPISNIPISNAPRPKSNLGAVLQGLRLDAHRGVHTLLHLPVHRAVRYQLQLERFVIIGPESDHWECLSLTHSLTNSVTFSKLVVI